MTTLVSVPSQMCIIIYPNCVALKYYATCMPDIIIRRAHEGMHECIVQNIHSCMHLDQSVVTQSFPDLSSCQLESCQTLIPICRCHSASRSVPLYEQLPLRLYLGHVLRPLNFQLSKLFSQTQYLENKLLQQLELGIQYLRPSACTFC